MVIFCIVFAFLLFLFPSLRIVVAHPFRTLRNAIVDLFNYVRYRQYNIAPTGNTRAYCGEFGHGKTLSCTHDIRKFYNRYNNKRFYDTSRKTWVTQKVCVLSNVAFTDIPYVDFVSLNQIVEWSRPERRQIDIDNNIRSVLCALVDEASVQLNSRNYKSNIDAEFLNSLMTCRHNNIAFLYFTAPRFAHIDAMLRQVTHEVVSCDKKWRFAKYRVYDGLDVEDCSNYSMLRALRRGVWFVRDSDYNAYDTLQCVDNFVKSYDSSDFLPEVEILLARGNRQEVDAEHIRKPSHSTKRLLRKRK